MSRLDVMNREISYKTRFLYFDRNDKRKNKKRMKAIWNGKVIAESNETIVVENNHYFPADSIKKEYFTATDLHSTCPWKGEASYYTVDVDGNSNPNAAWHYPTTSEHAKHIEGYVAFWRGIKVEE